MSSPANNGEIFTLARECDELFQKCAGQQPSRVQQDAALRHKDFEAWCFDLGVFAAPTASLDQILRYNDEVRGFVMQLLSILRRSLEFIKIHGPQHDSPSSSEPRPNKEENPEAAENLQRSVEAASRGISAVLERLGRLGATIRKHSASILSSRAKPFAEQDKDEEYRLLAKNIVAFKYPTAPSSLHVQLGESMADRRQRLRYIRRHQQKTAPEGQQESKAQRHHETGLSNSRVSRPTLAPAAVLRNQAVLRPRGNVPSQDTETALSTAAWTTRPTSSSMERVGGYESQSVISSSKASTTHCKKPLQFFSDLSLWEDHMRNRHSTKWTELIHKPTVWICDVDHDDQEFQDHGRFQEHLRNDHPDFTEGERKAVTILSVTTITRPKHICPRCGYDSAADKDGRPESAPRSDMDQLAQLAKHIAGHLRCLAFHTLDHLDSDRKSMSEQDTETTSDEARSRSCPSSELKDAKDISSGFSDNDEPRSVSTFDELQAQQDLAPGDDSSPQIVMEPLLVEKYERLLSKELMSKVEGDSKEVVNKFCGLNIRGRRALLGMIMAKLLEKMRDKHHAKRVIMGILDWITTCTTKSPKAFQPWVGFCLALIALEDVGAGEDEKLKRFACLTSKLPNHSDLELALRHGNWPSARRYAGFLIELESDALQLFQKMLELQLRVVDSGGQLAKSGSWGRLLFEAEDLEKRLIDDSYVIDVSRKIIALPVAEDIAGTIFDGVVALSEGYALVRKKEIQRLREILAIDPR
ncbi:hypothetical protein ACHAPT_005966 [Fusarium lateritium]